MFLKIFQFCCGKTFPVDIGVFLHLTGFTFITLHYCFTCVMSFFSAQIAVLVEAVPLPLYALTDGLWLSQKKIKTTLYTLL